MPRNAPSAVQRSAPPIVTIEPSADGKVVPLRLSVLPRHRAYLAAWLEAGARMGLCDADIGPDPQAEIYVWVRENPDPAYAVRAEGLRWVVFDHLRARRLGHFQSFEAALTCIRPVTPAGHLAA